MIPFEVVETERCESCGAWVVQLVDEHRCESCAGLEWRLWRSLHDVRSER